MTVAIAETTVLGPNVTEGDTQMTTLAFTAGTVAGNHVIMKTGRCLLLVKNDGVGAGTVTIASSADPYGRKSDITAFSVDADKVAARVFTAVGWEANAGAGDLLITPSATTMTFVAIPL